MSTDTKAFLLRLPSSLVALLDARCRTDRQTRTRVLRNLIEGFTAGPKPSTEPVAENALAESEEIGVTPVWFRLNAGEAALAKKASADYSSIAAWAGSLVRRELLCGAMLSDTDRELLRESNAQMRRVGINLNQIAHRLNVNELREVTEDDLALLDETYAFISSHAKRVDSVLASAQRRVRGS